MNTNSESLKAVTLDQLQTAVRSRGILQRLQHSPELLLQKRKSVIRRTAVRRTTGGSAASLMNSPARITSRSHQSATRRNLKTNWFEWVFLKPRFFLNLLQSFTRLLDMYRTLRLFSHWIPFSFSNWLWDPQLFQRVTYGLLHGGRRWLFSLCSSWTETVACGGRSNRSKTLTLLLPCGPHTVL